MAPEKIIIWHGNQGNTVNLGSEAFSLLLYLSRTILQNTEKASIAALSISEDERKSFTVTPKNK